MTTTKLMITTIVAVIMLFQGGDSLTLAAGKDVNTRFETVVIDTSKNAVIAPSTEKPHIALDNQRKFPNNSIEVNDIENANEETFKLPDKETELPANVEVQNPSSKPHNTKFQSHTSEANIKGFSQSSLPALGLPNDLKLPSVIDSSAMLPIMPDLEQIKRDQMLALAMAQFLQYAKSLARQSEQRFNSILKDLEHFKDEASTNIIEKQSEKIKNHLETLKNYQQESSKFMEKTLAVPEEFQKLVSDIKSQVSGNSQLENIFQINHLTDFQKHFANHFDTLKKLYQHEIEKFFGDIADFRATKKDMIFSWYNDLASKVDIKKIN
ncbi:uncharacterized protein LOC142226545 [Haematobia irritans]|uniref:uncharacterized protein LOC142226545 n=1 Tax=Haematobia irritans TaxID=7368 RepID=UPI003F5029D7